MKFRTLGMSGLRVSAVGLGCMGMSHAYGKPADRDKIREEGISYLAVADITDLKSALEEISHEFGITSISLQGGGVFDGGMLKQGVIDELSYVVYPGIDGTADSVSIFHYIGNDGCSPAARQSLKLISAEAKACGAVWLRYKTIAE